VKERTQRLVEQYTTKNTTLNDLGLQEGITRERVRQILSTAGVNAEQSHRKLSRSVRIEVEKRRKLDEHCMYSYGCPWDVVRQVTGRHKFQGLRNHPLVARYWSHHDNATRMHIEWTITLPEYAEIIGGRLMEIGLSRSGLVLGRKDKSGPFSAANCELVRLDQNSLATQGFKRAHVRRRERALRDRERVIEMYLRGDTVDKIAKAIRRCTATVTGHIAKARADGKLARPA
jgi:hypothetical protein